MPNWDPRTAWAKRVHHWAETVYRRVFWLVASLGLPPTFIVRLEVRGRRSGRSRSTILLAADHAGAQYLVSVLGEGADWVQNVRAAGGEGVLRHGRTHRVRLEEVPPNGRAPILKAYLKRALGARPVFEVSHDAPVEEFERIVSRHPVFRIVSESCQSPKQT